MRALERLAAWEAEHAGRRSFKQLIVTAFPPVWAVTLEGEGGLRVYACERQPPINGIVKQVEPGAADGTVGLADTIHAALDLWDIRRTVT